MRSSSCSFSCHVLLYLANGDLMGFGDNEFGNIGLDNKITQIKKPTKVLNDKTIKAIATGSWHNLILRENGDLLVFGRNDNGQLGIPNETDQLNQVTPKLLLSDPKIKNIYCGSEHSFFLKENGELWGFGHNGYKQLGMGHSLDQVVPIHITTDTDIVDVYCGGYHNLILKKNGDVLTFGDNLFGQLGNLISGNDQNMGIPQLLLNDKNIQSINCGFDHSMIYKKNGDLLIFGGSEKGQLGLGQNKNLFSVNLLMNDPNIQSISLGGLHSMILKKNGDLLVFGSNENGELGIGKPEVPYLNVPTFFMNDPLIVSIYSSSKSSYMYKSNGSFYAWGGNDFGQLGLGNNENKYSPVLILKDPSILIVNSGHRRYNWSTETHQFFTSQVKNTVLLFLLSLRRKFLSNNIKLPKFVTFEIIKMIF